MTFDSQGNWTRRMVLGAGACVVGTSLLRAQDRSVIAVMPGVAIPDEARKILETQTGIRMEQVPYLSPTDSVAKLFAPGGTARYDFMATNMYFVRAPLMGRKAGDEKIRPFDMSKIPNAAGMVELFKPEIQSRNGNAYMVPVFWGYDSPLFRTDKIPADDPATKSWGILFDDRFAGHTALRDDAYQALLVAALALGHKDPPTMPVSDLREVQKFLISKKRNIRALWTKFGEAVNLMSSGEVWTMHGWMPMRAALVREGITVLNARPKEGILFWNHAAFIPKDTQKAELAYAITNSMLSEEYGIALTRASNYGPMSAKALATFNDDEKKLFGLDVTGPDTARFTANFPNDMNAWIEAWAGFKSA
jgi:spermidine/putrescine-binding protein